jgi:hypothetical protein
MTPADAVGPTSLRLPSGDSAAGTGIGPTLRQTGATPTVPPARRTTTAAPDVQLTRPSPAAREASDPAAAAEAPATDPVSRTVGAAAPATTPDPVVATTAATTAPTAAPASAGTPGPTPGAPEAVAPGLATAARHAPAERHDERLNAQHTATVAPAAVSPATGMPAATAQATASPAEQTGTLSGDAVPLTPATGPADPPAQTPPVQTGASAAADTLTPAHQALNALVSIGRGQGTQQVTVRLHPQELGRLQIRIDQPKGGPARVMLTAEQPQTLDLLVRDQAQLQRALDLAGVPAEGRSLSFHLAAPQLAATPPDAGADPSRTALPPATPGPSTGLPGGSWGGSGGGQRGPQRDGFASGPQRLAGSGAEPADAPPHTARWLRAGVDITA